MKLEDFKREYEKAPVIEYQNTVKDNIPEVSVCITAYNHEKYIAKCLDSVLNQKTKFNFEILLGEDNSSDNTRKICIEYARKYPDTIRLFLHKRENNINIEGTPTGRFNFLYNLLSARGKYIALCDGDDFWTDECKLQKQIDYLETHPESIGCFHDTITVDENENKLSESYISPRHVKYDFELNLKELKSSYATCSLLCRSFPLQDMPIWYVINACDLTTDLLLAQYGTLDYIPENMGAYRIHSGGIWQGGGKAVNYKFMTNRYILLLKSNQFPDFKDYLIEQYLYFKRQEMGCYPKKTDKLKIVFQIFRDLSLLSKYPYLFMLSLFYSRLRPKSSV